MYATGGAKTIGDAARAYGMAPGSVYIAHRTRTGQELMAETERMLEGKAVDVSKLIAALSQKAVEKVAHLMSFAGSEVIQLSAAKDLLDRNPVTSKTQKIQVEDFTLGEGDAKRLAAAVVEAAAIRTSVGDAAKKDLLAIAGGGVETIELLPVGVVNPNIEGL